MSVEETENKGRVFTIELDSGSDLKKVTVPYGGRHILIEGTIGLLKHAELLENAILELVGTGGVLRVDFTKEDLAHPPSNRDADDERGEAP